MIPIKSQDEIQRMKEGGKRLAKAMGEILKEVRPGRRLSQLDQLAESLIEKARGQPSFKMVPNYHWAICIDVNQGVVHGVPNEYQIKGGDLISVDMGMFYQGLHTDMARTVGVQSSKFKVQSKNKVFLRVGERALRRAIKTARPGKRVGHLSQAIEEEVKRAGFSPIRTLTGHGVGKELHENPQIPCFLSGKISQTALLKAGMTLAVEVIYAQGKPEVVISNDGWTVQTADKSLAALFEDTVLVSPQGLVVLTS